jgi:Winged helix DNA-binding domain
VSDPLAAAAAVVCLHATEPASVYLSAWARSGASRTDVDRSLYAERSIVKQLAMRRTVFAFPRDLLPAVRGSAAARVAKQQAAQLARGVVAGGLTSDGAAWVERVCADVLALLEKTPATTRQLRAQHPVLGERVLPPQRAGATPTPVAPRVLTVLAADGSVVRGPNGGGWRVSRPYWTLTDTWLGSPVPPLPEAEGYAELVRRWLWAFGPGTEADITWWLGATKTAVRRALGDVGAVAVRLEDGSPAWLHPEDVDEVRSDAPWAALLPALDPTTMGWRGRSFYVDKPTASVVYDRAGNGMPTAWWDGRIVGRWVQEEDGTVIVVPVAPLTRSATVALRDEAGQLTAWLDGDVIRSSLQSPLV